MCYMQNYQHIVCVPEETTCIKWKITMPGKKEDQKHARSIFKSFSEFFNIRLPACLHLAVSGRLGISRMPTSSIIERSWLAILHHSNICLFLGPCLRLLINHIFTFSLVEFLWFPLGISLWVVCLFPSF